MIIINNKQTKSEFIVDLIHAFDGPGLNISVSVSTLVFPFFVGGSEWSAKSSKERLESELFLNFTRIQVILSQPEPSPLVFGAKHVSNNWKRKQL